MAWMVWMVWEPEIEFKFVLSDAVNNLCAHMFTLWHSSCTGTFPLLTFCAGPYVILLGYQDI